MPKNWIEFTISALVILMVLVWLAPVR